MEDIKESKLFAAFDKADEFRDNQNGLLRGDLKLDPTPEEDAAEFRAYGWLVLRLHEYQEQAYLLDPYLEDLVAPVLLYLKAHIQECIQDHTTHTSQSCLERVMRLLHYYIVFRGYKTITRFFPHEIADVSVVLDYMALQNCKAREPKNWQMRYALLLWLSLICMIPFDLAQFDEVEGSNRTMLAIEALGHEFLDKAGVEREGAAILLARFYTRKDTRDRFDSFLQSTLPKISESSNIFLAIGILRVLSEIAKSGPPELTTQNTEPLMQIADAVGQNSILVSNSLARRFRIKLYARIALRLIPTRANSRRRRLVLPGVTLLSESLEEGNELEITEHIETVLEHLFEALQDKDTIVRYSSAKYVARVSSRLPSSFSDQVLDTVLGLFSIHSIAAATIYDMPTIAEATWHGASLACAEMARRDLIPRTHISQLVGWLKQALLFDLRKGAHSIGSNVRDAAAYVLWALARSHDAEALRVHADELSKTLAVVSLFDREVHIRRAASAAFQENVGRTSLFAHGIDVLRKTDFYAVSLRRNSFLVAASQVAEHTEYRRALVDHLLNVSVRHWDVEMRELGAQALSLICLQDFKFLSSLIAERATELVSSVDVVDIHGGLLVLIGLANAHRKMESNETCFIDLFRRLRHLPAGAVRNIRNELIISAACTLVSVSLTAKEVEHSQVESGPYDWKEVVLFGLKHPTPSVQEAAAHAMATSGSSQTSQSLGRLIGELDYLHNPSYLKQCVQCAVQCADRETSPFRSNIEARRTCCEAIPKIVDAVAPLLQSLLSAKDVQDMIQVLLKGLDDYSVNERGDVGSFIRIASMRGLVSITQTLLNHPTLGHELPSYFSSAQYHSAVGGVLKQGVERLDSVRQVAGDLIHTLLRLPPPNIPNGEEWLVAEKSTIKSIFDSDAQVQHAWSDGAWLYPRAVQLLDCERYRKDVLNGLVFSVGSKSDSNQSSVSSSLVSYAKSAADNTSNYTLGRFVDDLIRSMKPQLSNNNVVIPVLHTFNILLEGGGLESLYQDTDGVKRLGTLLTLATNNAQRLKSVPRILESMKIVVQFFAVQSLLPACVATLPTFLGHSFPRVRSECAEALYLVLQSQDVGIESDEMEELLLETEWAAISVQEATEIAKRVAGYFR